MNLYRGIQIEIMENNFKLFNKAAVHRFQDSQGILSTYTTGEAYVSFPEDLTMPKEIYVRKIVDTLYARMVHAKAQETRGKIY